MKFILSRLFLLGACAVVLHEAYQTDPNGQPCPRPCRCLKFEGLWSVYCNRTGITAIPTGIPANTQLLDLSFNSIGSIPEKAFAGLVNLQQLFLAGIGFIDGVIAEKALDLPMLQTIDLSENSLTFVPTVLPHNLTYLGLYGNKITYLEKKSFVNYTTLVWFDLQQNGLRAIDIGTFDPLPDVTELDLAFNDLTDESIPPKLFCKNTKLETLGLRFNQLTKMVRDLPASMLHLDYVGNKIKTIPAHAFETTPNVQTIELWEGQVTTIEDNAFYGLSKLTILDFMQDKISSTITKDTFNGLTGLKTLYMDLNNVSMIEPGAFRSFGSITSLWFSANQLSTLDPEVLDTRYIPHLSELFIDTNPWYCDCHLRWLREKVNNASYVIQDPHLITCAGPSKVAGKAWDVLQPSDFVCP